ncbi:T-complex protein 11 homolog [Erythrolamprus reginae]|uniref:T-complex protein 11 homolog n=1 Tax=Erythrolamprus reginae TaxID=121349 RepID=UPI00396C31BC
MPNPKETTSSDCNDTQTTDCNSRKLREHEEIQGGDIPKLCPPNIPSSNSPQIHSISELMETASEVSKMTIAHEIVVNQDFKLQEVNLSPNSLESRVKETVHKAFWDNLKEQLSKTPPDYSQAIKLLQEIKETLLSLLLPRQTRLKSQIEEALDIELIKQEAEHGALDIPKLTTYILGTMAMLCAPIRDEEIQSLRIMADPVHLLSEIFRVLNLMKMDMVNFTIQSLRPHLLEHSVQYERKKFQELLNKLPGSLTYTTDWLHKAVTKVSKSDLLPSSSTSGTNGPPVSTFPMSAGKVSFIHSPTAVLNQAYMDLLDWELGREHYPETMLMDKARLHALQVEVNQLVIIASVLLVSSNICGNELFSSPRCGSRLKRVIKALLEGLPDIRSENALMDISNQIHMEVNAILNQLGYSALSTDKAASLKGQLRNLGDKNNAVRVLIEQRIQTFLRHCLYPGGQNAKNLLQGLSPIQEELLEIGQRFGSLIHHNRQVFGPYYSEILKKLLLPEAKSETGEVSSVTT